MLSYRHSFHAGNFGDVIKHVVLIELLRYATLKGKAITYIDTHAGAGCFDLRSEHASKLNEWEQGVGRLKRGEFPELETYFSVIDEVNPDGGLDFYPGSPIFAQALLRGRDSGKLFELHSRDCETLTETMAGDLRFEVRRFDGFNGLIKQVPPPSSRAVVLIDPPYEVKEDYDTVVQTLADAYRKFPTGTYALWYPVVERSRIDQMVAEIRKSEIRDVRRWELGVKPDGTGGMTAAGMIVLNPPWTLQDKLDPVLTRLAAVLGNDHAGFAACDVIAEE